MDTGSGDPPPYTSGCTVVCVTRTNIDIDDDLVLRVMRRFNLRSKRAAVDLALRRLLGEPMTRDEILALQGVGWSGYLDGVRRAEAGELG